MISASGARFLVKLYLDVKCFLTGITCSPAQVFLDTQQLIVFGDAIGARQRSSFDLPGICSDCEIGYERIFSLAGAMRDDRGPPVRLREGDAVESFSQRAYLIDFDQYRVGDAEVDSLLQERSVGHKQIVADK